MTKKQRFSDEIREAIEASGMTRYTICKSIGFTQGAMSRFMSGKGGISLETLDRLAELLGLRLATQRARKLQKGGDDGQRV